MKPNDTLTEIGNIAFAFAFIVLAAALGYRYIGLPPLIIALEIHMMEEYLTGFGPAMSRLFNITRTERGFLIVFAFDKGV